MTNSLRLTHHVLLVRVYMFRPLVTIIRTFNIELQHIGMSSIKFVKVRAWHAYGGAEGSGRYNSYPLAARR